jgi:hypothetical protein
VRLLPGCARAPRPRRRDSQLPAHKHRIQELLVMSRRRLVIDDLGTDRVEALAELVREVFSVIPSNVQPTAPVRTVWTEGRDDEASARRNRFRSEVSITAPVFLSDQEMEDRPVVPDIEDADVVKIGDVG